MNIQNIRAKLSARRRLSYAILVLDKFFRKNVEVRTSRKLQVFSPTTLSQSKNATYYLTNVKPGRYTFKIEHNDPFLMANRKSLLARIKVSNNKISSLYAKKMGVGLAKKNSPFLYLGGGKKNRDSITQFFTINIPSGQRWIRIKLAPLCERNVNINKLEFSEVNFTEDDVRKKVKKFLQERADNNRSLSGCEYIIYADINPNVVDGSSVWLSSMISILCGLGKCVFVSKVDLKNDLVMSNVMHNENLSVISPSVLGMPDEELGARTAIEIVRELDFNLPVVRTVMVRGIDAASDLHSDRQFKGRSAIYLTDFYNFHEGQAYVSSDNKAKVALCASQAGVLFTQTSVIRDKLFEISGKQTKALITPPAIPDDLPERQENKSSALKIGYAGKIAPDWGVGELVDWVEEIRSKTGIDVEVHVVANKISNSGIQGIAYGYAEEIKDKLNRPGVFHYQDYNRSQAMNLMASMDYVWCWRPPRLEDHTLELSTKLVEMCAVGASCICYPSRINKSILGEDYPFYIKGKEGFSEILSKDFCYDNSELIESLRKEHSISELKKKIAKALYVDELSCTKKICFSGHDYKFIDPFISHLKRLGHQVVKDEWGWGGEKDIASTKSKQKWADIIFCEWGLANAVWHSENSIPGKKVYIRVHLQEINERARKFGYKVNIQNVDGVIFVSEYVMEKAIELFGWPREKMSVIPNYVLTDEFLPKLSSNDQIKLGMVGIIPQRKRFDRALDVLIKLREKEEDAVLYIKGPRPETLDFMHGASRKDELNYYYEQYEKIEKNSLIKDRVIFDPWGNDVALWYEKIDYILSPSDFESFHYALADGVLSGCYPLVWPWESASSLYTEEWVVKDGDDALNRILRHKEKKTFEKEEVMFKNRQVVENKYGYKKIYNELCELLGVQG